MRESWLISTLHRTTRRYNLTSGTPIVRETRGVRTMSALHRTLFAIAAALVAAPTAVSAAPLSVVTVTAPDINCVFDPACTIVVTDSAGDIVIPGMSGKAILQSRTFTGASGAPAEGTNGYEYRIDLTQATSAVDASCVTDLTIDFGPVLKFQYNKVGPTDD